MFFDRYLKDIHTGWELMPKVRLDVMDAYDFDFRPKREEREFPIARTEYKKLYLDGATNKAAFEPFEKESETEYDPNERVPFEVKKDEIVDPNVKINYDEKKGLTYFDYKFTEDTEISGFMKLKLWVECRYIKTEWFEDRKMTFTEDNGDGIHVIHTGGKYDSFLQIPVIPPKYKSGKYEVR